MPKHARLALCAKRTGLFSGIAVFTLVSPWCGLFAAPAEVEPLVAAAPIVRQDLARSLTLQAELRPYNEVELHAKVAGYLRRIEVDIGDRVKAGDLIATLEVPELREELARAQAMVQRAETNYQEAHLNYTRLVSVGRGQPNLVAQQEIDAVQTKDATASLAVTEAKADLERLRTLEAYTRISAPFDGVITKRFADPGALIQAGTTSSTQALPLVRISQNERLRLVFPVSVSHARAVNVGDPLEIGLGEGEPRLNAKVARFNRRIATDTRTMLVEADLANPDLALIPGMYATVSLRVEYRPRALAAPVESVAGTKQPTVYVIGKDGRIEERIVKLGIETPTHYEVLSGVQEGELVMIGNRSQVRVGQKVATKKIEVAAAQ
jgi:RND family efflux transporter MFP subunit